MICVVRVALGGFKSFGLPSQTSDGGGTEAAVVEKTRKYIWITWNTSSRTAQVEEDPGRLVRYLKIWLWLLFGDNIPIVNPSLVNAGDPEVQPVQKSNTFHPQKRQN